MKKLSLFLMHTKIVLCSFAQEPIGIFKYNKDIGSSKQAWSASYAEASQIDTIKGFGYNIWGQRDEHHYLYNKLTGNFI